MNEKELNELTDKVNQGKATDAELHLFTAYLNQITSVSDAWDTSKLGTENAVKRELLSRIESGITIQKRLHIWPRIAAAASIILCMGLGYYFYSSHKQVQVNRQAARNEIRPGGNNAILTLGNGSQIVLNDARNGTLASQGNTKIIKLSNGKLTYRKSEKEGGKSTVLYNTMTTPRGGQYQLTLPDGTQVWLNAESSITYPTLFEGKKRDVSITGEVYFEVAKNKDMPFYVRSGEQTVRVLGTHFNINSYHDEDAIKTTLLEGSVKVSSEQQANQKPTEIIIKPGEQAYIVNRGFKVEHVDTDDIVAWKEGVTSINNADIKSIMRQLCRWYDVDVKYEPNLPERSFTGEISRTANLSEVFKILEMSKINFKIQGRTVIVSP